MKTPNKNLRILIALFGFLMLAVISCKKINNNPENPLNGHTTANFKSNLKYSTMTDQDGNIYKTIKIGTQVWMAENLRAVHYQNGDPVEKVEKNTTWVNLTTGAYSNYNNTNNLDTIATYGRLYNWYAVNDSRKLSPKGWHIPTDEEWSTLINYLGGDSIAGGKMKEIGTAHWLKENVGATNECGLTAIPGGCRDNADGSFYAISYDLFWWSSTEDDAKFAWYRFLNNKLTSVEKFSWYLGKKNSGFSVRCVKN